MLWVRPFVSTQRIMVVRLQAFPKNSGAYFSDGYTLTH